MDPDFGGPQWPPNGFARSIFDTSHLTSPSPPSPFATPVGADGSPCYDPRSRNPFFCRRSGWPEQGKLPPTLPKPRAVNKRGEDFGVPYYSRHIMVCENIDWTEDFGKHFRTAKLRLPGSMARALETEKDLDVKTQLTVCEGTGGEALIFPDMLKISGLTKHDVGIFIEEVLRPSNEMPRLPHVEVLSGTHIFVSCEGKRSASGQDIVIRLQAEIAKHSLSNVTVWRTGKLVRNKLEADVVIFSDCFAAGCDWYGNLKVQEVPELVEGHVLNGRVLEHRWLGCMALDGTCQRTLKEDRERCMHPQRAPQLDGHRSGSSSLSSSFTSCDAASEPGDATDNDSPVSPASEGFSKSPQQKLMDHLSHIREMSRARWFSERRQRFFQPRTLEIPVPEAVCIRRNVSGFEVMKEEIVSHANWSTLSVSLAVVAVSVVGGWRLFRR